MWGQAGGGQWRQLHSDIGQVSVPPDLAVSPSKWESSPGPVTEAAVGPGGQSTGPGPGALSRSLASGASALNEARTQVLLE